MKKPWTYNNCTLERIIDGDTIIVRIDLGFDIQTVREVRLRNINCPELRGDSKPAAIKALEFARTWLAVGDGRFTVISYGWDKYRRIEGELWQGKSCLNQELVRSGNAVEVK